MRRPFLPRKLIIYQIAKSGNPQEKICLPFTEERKGQAVLLALWLIERSFVKELSGSVPGGADSIQHRSGCFTAQAVPGFVAPVWLRGIGGLPGLLNAAPPSCQPQRQQSPSHQRPRSPLRHLRPVKLSKLNPLPAIQGIDHTFPADRKISPGREKGIAPRKLGKGGRDAENSSETFR